MQIFIRQHTGRTISLDVDPDADILAVLKLAYEKRADNRIAASFENFQATIRFIFAGHPLSNDYKLSDYAIRDANTLHEVARQYAYSENFDWSTLTLLDPISGAVAVKPYLLNPGCNHPYDETELKKWIKNCWQRREAPSCPCCSYQIDKHHLARLFPNYEQALNRNTMFSPSLQSERPQENLSQGDETKQRSHSHRKKCQLL